MNKTIYEDEREGIRITCGQPVGEDFVSILRDTVWGTTGTLYRNPEFDVEELGHPAYLPVRFELDGRLVGTYMLIHKTVQLGATTVDAYHGTMLTSDPDCAGKHYGQLLLREVRRHFLVEATGPTLHYGYVETDNHRSLAATTKAGYRTLGTMGVVPFSRIFPKEQLPLHRLEEGEQAELAARIRSRYAGHLLLDVEQSLDPRRTWVYKEDGRIRASAFAVCRRVQLVHLPDRVGRFLIRHGHRIPLLGRVLDFGDSRQMWFGALFVEEGDEELLPPLLESILVREGVYGGLVYLDLNGPWTKILQEVGKLGSLNALAGIHTAEIVGGFKGVPPEDARVVEGQPIWISPLESF